MHRTTVIATTLLLLAGCGETQQRPDPGAQRATHNAAAAAMDSSFDKELDGGGAKPAAKPVAKPAEKPTAEKPAVRPKTTPAAEGPAVEHGRPAWVDQPPSEPGKLYAVGGAARGKRDLAQANARKELAAQLRVHVQAVTTIDEGEKTKFGPGSERITTAWSNFRNEARLSVDRDLNGTSIVELAEDGKEVFALAMLDCVAWAAQLRQEISAVDAKLSAERDRVGAAGGGLRQAAQALRAVGPLAARREALINDLIQAEPKGQLPPCPVDVPAVLQACARQLGAISVRLEGAPDAVFAARTQDAMSRVGLTVTEKTGGSAIGIRLALRVNSRRLPGDNAFFKYTVAGSASVVDPASGTVAGSLQIDESAADPDDAQAKARMLDKAAEALAKAINENLLDLLAQ